MKHTLDFLSLRRTIIVMMAVILFPIHTVLAFGWFGSDPQQEPVPITLKLSGQTSWNEQGIGEALVDLQMTSMAEESRTGELRLVLLAINGRIDFDAVTIKVLNQPPADTEHPEKDTYTSFFVEQAVTLGKESQHWRFKITLPAGSRQPNIGLQLFAIYRGKMPSEENWVARDTLLLNVPTPELK